MTWALGYGMDSSKIDMATPHILVAIFAVLDTQSWDFKTLSSWIDSLVVRAEQPKSWVLELCLSTSLDGSIEVIRQALQDEKVRLPDDVGDILAGLIWRRITEGGGDPQTLWVQLLEIVDAYGTATIDVEWLLGPAERNGASLSASLKRELNALATHAVEQINRLGDDTLYEKERGAIEA